jgi:NAD(P)-dependent dehydrogenase (short-subunit alcohol dehydrogenase family)
VSTVELPGRVAIVTGAGGGLGREHALALAARGAHVVVNDVGGALDGSGNDRSRAQMVVDEIISAGGTAIADANSVADMEGAEAMVRAATETFGRVDIVVNNAGIIQDKSFHNMTGESFDQVIAVHLKGSFNVTKAAWPQMREQGFGRLLFTSSGAGVFGNFGQANYAAAKAGLIGLTKTLAIEGARNGITANAICPIARTRMTEEILGKFLVERAAARLVSPLVVWLASDECTDTGNVYTVGGGRVARFVVGMTEGWTRTDGELTPEDVREHWGAINDVEELNVPRDLRDDFRALRTALL